MAEHKLLKLTISRVHGPVFDGEVVSVTVPGLAGEMTILAQHSSLISPLKKGTITLKKTDGNTEMIEAESGTLEISYNHATILL
jgi:F-type H+-transporting ATPase subunit epsilon